VELQGENRPVGLCDAHSPFVACRRAVHLVKNFSRSPDCFSPRGFYVGQFQAVVVGRLAVNVEK
jgi:hypothetical protein